MGQPCSMRGIDGTAHATTHSPLACVPAASIHLLQSRPPCLFPYPAPSCPPPGWDPARIARRVGFALFGVPATEANPAFLEEVRERPGPSNVHSSGGSIRPPSTQPSLSSWAG